MAILDYTSRVQKEGKRGFVPDELTSIFNRIDIKINAWHPFVAKLSGFSYAIGNSKELVRFGNPYRKRALRGATFANQCFEKCIE